MDNKTDTILVTGGLGYIGAHTSSLLLKNSKVVIFDNLSNSKEEVSDSIARISGCSPTLVIGDILDKNLLQKTIKKHKVSKVIHFAGLKAVSESVVDPTKYYKNNVSGTISLLEAMTITGVKQIVFSSSATVYGKPHYLPYDEAHPINQFNPYGKCKHFVEEILKDLCASDKDFSAVSLRYFNPIGAHASGLIGDNPNNIPNNLMPYITRVASGEIKYLEVFGNDYNTKDGTCVRDYIHVMDLSKAHILSLDFLNSNKGFHVFNIGSERPYSVLEVVEEFARVNSVKLDYKFSSRRKGDIAAFYSDSRKAHNELNWKANITLGEMCSSAWLYEKTKK